jgi:glycosyltransferase involved in cell wall biosynthesis
MKPELTVITVNYNTREWLELLVQSLRKFAPPVPTQMIVVDNGSKDGSREWLTKQDDLTVLEMPANIGHGRGLDLAFSHAWTSWVAVFDVDAHVQNPDWFGLLGEAYSREPGCRLVAAAGGSVKPIHPIFMFFSSAFFRQHHFRFEARDGFDVGRKIYFDIVDLGFKVNAVQPSYEENQKKFYGNVFGTDYYFGGRPTIYHNWYSARMANLAPGQDAVDGYTLEEFRGHKATLFGHPLVKDILAFGRKG